MARRAKTVEEYIEWVKSAVFEVEELKECLLYETEDMTRFPGYLEPLGESVRKVYQDMCDGNYHFGRVDLPFMDIVYRQGNEIPFNMLLKQINETHRKGLDVEESEL